MSEAEERFPKEKRRAPRVGGTLVEYTLKGKGTPLKQAFIKDICIYGVCIFMPETVKRKAAVYLNIFLFGDQTPLIAEGKVIWQKPGGDLGYYNVGIEFTQMDKDHEIILSDYIEANYKPN